MDEARRRRRAAQKGVDRRTRRMFKRNARRVSGRTGCFGLVLTGLVAVLALRRFR